MSAELIPAATIAGRIPSRSRAAAIVDARGVRAVLIVVAVALWFVARVFVAPVDHDEGQYVASAVLSLDGAVYRDFVSLQPPLQSWLYSPLALVAPGGIFLGMRLLTAAIAVAALAALFHGQRQLGIGRGIATATTLLMGACSAFQFSASIVRNDMLPLALLAGATMLAVRVVGGAAPVRSGRAAFGCGLLLALALATKLSYGPMIAVVGLCLCAMVRTIGMRRLAWFAAGTVIGLVPLAWAAAAHPKNFAWGVWTFARTAPYDWYARVGRAVELDPIAKLVTLAQYMLTSPVAPALAVVAMAWWRRAQRPDRVEVLLACMVAAGLLGAVLPTPTHKQYLLPMLPPLFMLLGLALARTRAGATARTALAIGAALGLSPTLTALGVAVRSGSPVVAVQDQAAVMHAVVAAAAITGPIATLSPDRAIDSGLPLDPRFAPGPFVFRSGNLLSSRVARRLRVTIPSTLKRDFVAAPPAAVLVGYERNQRHGDIQVDQALEATAIARGYRRVALPDGTGRLYLRPAGSPSPAGMPFAALMGLRSTLSYMATTG